MYRYFFKRLIDFLIALILIILSLPFLLIGAIAIKADDKGPIFFSQQRVGKDNKIFTIYKLRSMKMQTHDLKTGRKLRDKERVTPAGRFVRKTSIDELPQLFNILKGDMSFVGPRPLLVKYLPYYTNEELHRHDVRPGITGLAQVNGRSNLPWEDRFAYDLDYVNHVTFLGDISIWCKTIQKVFKGADTSVNTRPVGFVSLNLQRQGHTWNDTFTPHEGVPCGILMSGATGILGQQVAAKLLEKGIEVVALRSSSSEVALDERIKVMSYEEFFALDKDAFDKFSGFGASGFETIHLAFPRKNTAEDIISGIDFTRNFVAHAIELGTSRVINASSQSVYDPHREAPALETDESHPNNLYGMAKSYCEYIVEDLAMSKSVPAVHLRIASLVGSEYSNRLVYTFINRALQNSEVTINDIDTMSFLHVSDCADAVVEVIGHSQAEGIYNLGTSEAYTLVELCDCINTHLAEQDLKSLNYSVINQDAKPVNRSLNVDKFAFRFNWKAKVRLYDIIDEYISQVK